MSLFKMEEMISALRETVAEIEPKLSRKRTLCCKHGVLLKRLILKFGDGGDEFTADTLEAILEGERQKYIVELAAQQYTQKGGGEKPWKRSVSILGIPKLLE